MIAERHAIRLILYKREKEHAIVARDIRKIVDIPPVAIRIHIKELRRQGCPIASGGSGYWWAESKEDLKSTIRHLRSRAIDELVTARELRKCFNDNQLTMFEG